MAAKRDAAEKKLIQIQGQAIREAETAFLNASASHGRAMMVALVKHKLVDQRIIAERAAEVQAQLQNVQDVDEEAPVRGAGTATDPVVVD